MDHETDFLVIGSGGGGMVAAAMASELGGDSLVIEKTELYGGSTAMSGGVIWVPNNHLMKAAGIDDSAAEAWQYMHALSGDEVDADKLRAYIRHAPAMVKELEERGVAAFGAATSYMDYYPEIDGGKPGGRSLDPEPFSARKLGDTIDQQRTSRQGRVLTISMTAREGHLFVNFGWRAMLLLAKRLFLYYLDFPSRLKKRPDNRMTLGRALTARLRYALLQRKVPLWLNTELLELLQQDGRVVGALVKKDGQEMRVAARKGVLIATGGFDHNTQLREQYQHSALAMGASAGNPGNTGDGILAGQKLGAALEFMHCAWWTPTYRGPEGAAEALIAGKSMPGSIFVNQAGERFTNEAAPYEDVTKAQLDAHNADNSSVPCFMVFDARFRRSYPIGPIGPSKAMPDSMIPDQLKRANFLRKADSLAALAMELGIDSNGLQRTVERVNQFARTGVDEDFARGTSLHDRYYSDPKIEPNPCLGEILEAPFYAIEILAGDLGTKGGLKTDASARVLDQQGEVIHGLYATGNTSGSVMGNSYPGAGSTIGPSMTFGYIAAHHALGVELE
jgi:3-oxosteroid 1-dehydrogenase